jgi:type IV fimbrial biogenesis protein FimT
MSRERGFTLPELLTVLTVTGIVLVIAVPNLLSMVRSDTLTTTANNLVFALNYARNEAVKRDTVVSVCPSSDGQTCLSGSTSWATGWMVYYTASGSTTPIPLQAWPALPATFTLVTKIPASGAPTTSSVIPAFQPTGMTYTNTTGLASAITTTAVEFILCDPRGPSKAVDMELLPTGRTQAALTPGYSVYISPVTEAPIALTTCS